jgi:hypothetical protein
MTVAINRRHLQVLSSFYGHKRTDWWTEWLSQIIRRDARTPSGFRYITEHVADSKSNVPAEVKVKITYNTPWRHRRETKLYPFFNFGAKTGWGCERQAPNVSPPGKKHSTHFEEGCDGLRASLEGCRIFRPHHSSNPGPSSQYRLLYTSRTFSEKRGLIQIDKDIVFFRKHLPQFWFPLIRQLEDTMRRDRYTK